MNSLEDDLAAVLKPRLTLRGRPFSRQIGSPPTTGAARRPEADRDGAGAAQGGACPTTCWCSTRFSSTSSPLRTRAAQKIDLWLLKLARTYNLASS